MTTTSPGGNSILLDLAIHTMENLVKEQPPPIKLDKIAIKGDIDQVYETTSHPTKHFLSMLSAAAEHCESLTGDKKHNCPTETEEDNKQSIERIHNQVRQEINSDMGCMYGKERKDLNHSKLKNNSKPYSYKFKESSTANNVNKTMDSQVKNVKVFNAIDIKSSVTDKETIKREHIVRSSHLPVMISSHLMQGKRHVSKTSVLNRANPVDTDDIPMPSAFAEKLLSRKYGSRHTGKSLNSDKKRVSVSVIPLNSVGFAGETKASVPVTMETCEVQHPHGSETKVFPINSEVLQRKKSLLRGLLTDVMIKDNSSSPKTNPQQLDLQDQNVYSKTFLDPTLKEENQAVCYNGLKRGECNKQEQLITSRRSVASPTLTTSTVISQQAPSSTSYIFIPQIPTSSAPSTSTSTLQKGSSSLPDILITPESATSTPSNLNSKQASKSPSSIVIPQDALKPSLSNVISQESSNVTPNVTPKVASETTRSTVTPPQNSSPYPVTLVRPKSSSPTSPALLLQPTSTPSVIPPQTSSPTPSSANPQEPATPAPVFLISHQGSNPAPFHLVPQGMCVIPASSMTEGNAKVSIVQNNSGSSILMPSMNPTTNLGPSKNIKLYFPQGRLILPSLNGEQGESLTNNSEVPVLDADSANSTRGEFLKIPVPVLVSRPPSNDTPPSTSEIIPQGKLGPLKPGRTKTKTVPLYCLNPDDFPNEEDKLRICKAKNAKRNRDGIKKKLQQQQLNLDLKPNVDLTPIHNNAVPILSIKDEHYEEEDRTINPNEDQGFNITLKYQNDDLEPVEKKLRIAFSDSDDSNEKEKQTKAGAEKDVKFRKFVKVEDDAKCALNTELRLLEAKLAELREKINNQ